MRTGPRSPAGRAVPQLLLLAAVPLVYALLAYQRRWLSDDGLIVTRTVRQLLAGNGPVVNVGERAEANTSTAWTYLLTATGWVTGIDLARLTVLLGIVLAVAALALGLDAARLLHTRDGTTRFVLPLGAVVVLGLPPFWDYASSGLETGLTFAWIAGAWWAVVRCSAGRRLPGPAATAVLCGLAPLVRPELAVAGAAYLVALWVVLRPSRRRAAGLLAAAAVIPVAYQVFRMGFYGLLVPLPAVSKEAGGAVWGRGWAYVLDLVSPYRLWAPLLLVVAVLGITVARSRRDRAALALIGAPVLSAGVLVLYVVRVGGDFMHARMLLPPLLLLLLPVLAVPLRRPGRAAVAPVAGLALVAAWAFTAAGARPAYVGEDGVISARGVADEREYWLRVTREENPLTAAPFVAALDSHRQAVEVVRGSAEPTLVVPVSEGFLESRLLPGLPWNYGLVLGTLGTAGAIVALDEVVVDPAGLAYPLAAHAERGQRGRAGHEKLLKGQWLVADLLTPDSVVPGVLDADEIAQARRVLACPALDELTRSVRDPLTPQRFWDNLTGAVGRTALRVPADPEEAADRYCSGQTPSRR